MGLFEKLFGRKHSAAPLPPTLQVALIFACDMVENNKEILERAAVDLHRSHPGELVGKMDITIAPKANTNTITMVLRVADKEQALAFQKRGEEILRHHGLRS